MTGAFPDSSTRTHEIVLRHGPDAPDVSVIIPTFNRERYLHEAVGSAIAQGGHHRVEVVVVDDGSSDGSVDAAISATRAATGALVIRQANAGPSAARNAGIRHARGRFLSFLDSDDRLVGDKINRQIGLLTRDPSAGMCVGRWGWYDEHFERLLAAFGPRRAATWPILPSFLRNEHFPVATALFRREVVLAAPPWPESMRNLEDHTWMIRMGLSGVRCIHLPVEVLQVREHGSARASAVSRERASAAYVAFAHALLALDWPPEPALRDALAERLMVIAQTVWCGGREEAAERIFDRAEDLAGSPALRHALRAVWLAERASPRSQEVVRKVTEKCIGLRTRLRWHLPSRAWRGWTPISEKGATLPPRVGAPSPSKRTMTQPVYIVSATRTPIGTFLGNFAELTAPRLGAIAIEAALARAGVTGEQIGELFMGNVLSAGIGQAPARQASKFAGVPDKVPCTTVSKVCGSGLQAVIFGAKTVALGDAGLVVAGGMESMSNVPYYLKKARGGYRMGNGELVDGMIFDGLWDPYNDYHMGNAGELCARELGIGREAQDEFAKESYRRALSAQKEGRFAAELVSVSVPQRKGDPRVVSEDEEPGRGDASKMGSLRPAFTKDGTITAANASKINDGASALVLASEAAVREHGLTPLARIVGYGSAAQAPEWFTTAPAVAIDETTKRLGISKNDIDLFEINEAFAVVALAVAQKCGLDLAKVNVNGGAVALGHPIGASGARILTTLVHALKARNARRGLATLCIGGGEAVAVIVESV